MEDADEAAGGTCADTVLQGIRAKAVSRIESEPDADAELLAILTSRIVVASPDEDAVDLAAADIQKLAEARALP